MRHTASFPAQSMTNAQFRLSFFATRVLRAAVGWLTYPANGEGLVSLTEFTVPAICSTIVPV